jgi:hypothetical protein
MLIAEDYRWSHRNVSLAAFLKNRDAGSLLDLFDPFVAAPDHMLCDECDEFIPLDKHGFNYDHHCLEPRVIREAHANLMHLLFPASSGTRGPREL